MLLALLPQAMGLELDGTGFGLGKRSQRYAAVIEDGVVSSMAKASIVTACRGKQCCFAARSQMLPHVQQLAVDNSCACLRDILCVVQGTVVTCAWIVLCNRSLSWRWSQGLG